MLHLDLVCVASAKDATLRKLRDLKAVHLDLSSAAGHAVLEAKGAAADAEQAVRLIRKARGKSASRVDVRPRSVAEVLALADDRAKLVEERDRLEREIKIYSPYGDFDPALAKKLLDRGIDIDDRLPAKLPQMRLSKMLEKLSRVENRINIDDAKLAMSDDDAIAREFPQLRDKLAFAAAKELMEEHGAVAAVSGWVPATAVDKLRAEAAADGWGVLLREPAADEIPPTLVEPPRLFRPVKVLFDGLGIAPGYTEADVTVPFMCYFSLFFAMLVGDGAYGAIFLAATLWGWKKTVGRRTPVVRSWLVLMSVFSTATVIWGLLSNTWFGLQIPWCASWPTVRWLADPSYNNMMLLCFTIGTSHLMLARVWNGVCRLNSLDCLVEFGWAGVLFFMYFVVNSIVGIWSGIPAWTFWVFGVSLAMIISKTRGIDLGMLPLNVMGSMGDIISYVRLFAVGYASLQVAQNFNEMAVAFDLPLWAKAVPALLVLLLGHMLNLALAGLAVLVHAVRLNTLEFSTHKGLTWSGYGFNPFRKNSQNKE